MGMSERNYNGHCQFKLNGLMRIKWGYKERGIGWWCGHVFIYNKYGT